MKIYSLRPQLSMRLLCGLCGGGESDSLTHYTGFQQFQRNFDNGVSHADNQETFHNVETLGEGKRLVFDTARYLIRHHEFGQLFRLVYISGCKVVGYKLGEKYYKLPKKLISFCTMNKKYWQE